jgi:uncharacterized protein
MTFCYKKHTNSETLLAISDKSLVGKTFEEGELKIRITKEFYHEHECTGKEALKLIKESDIVNAVGKDVIDILLKEKLIEKSKILKIKGIPHAQIIKI